MSAVATTAAVNSTDQVSALSLPSSHTPINSIIIITVLDSKNYPFVVATYFILAYPSATGSQVAPIPFNPVELPTCALNDCFGHFSTQKEVKKLTAGSELTVEQMAEKLAYLILNGSILRCIDYQQQNFSE